MLGANNILLQYKYGLSFVNDEQKTKISSKVGMYFYEDEYEKKYVTIKIYDDGAYEIENLSAAKKMDYLNYKLVNKNSINNEIKNFIFKKTEMTKFILKDNNLEKKLSKAEFIKLNNYIEESHDELYSKNEKLDIENKCNDNRDYFLIGYGEELKVKDIYFYSLADYLDKPINYLDYVLYEYDNCSIIKKSLNPNRIFYFPKTKRLKEYLDYLFENRE